MEILAILVLIGIPIAAIAIALRLKPKEQQYTELFIGKYYYNKSTICGKNKIITPVYIKKNTLLAVGNVIHFTKNLGDFFNGKSEAYYPLRYGLKKYIVRIDKLGKILELELCQSEN